MADLLALQRALAASLQDPSAALLPSAHLAGDGAAIERRLGIYRANIAASVAKALGAAYPVVAQWVGAEFFAGLARAYGRARPSGSGDLYDHGAEFGDFLADFPHTRSLPYLPDLARLEWQVHRAYGAADAPAFEVARLAAVAPADQGSICFQWAAGTAVVESAFPIVRLWTLHQPGHEGAFTLEGAGAERARVGRDGWRVDVALIDPAEARFLQHSLGGATLESATAAALAEAPEFDLGALLPRLVSARLITGFTLASGCPT